jgi:hypothetical protein
MSWGGVDQALSTPMRWPLPLPPSPQYWGSYDIPRYTDAALYLMDMKAEGAIKEVGGRGEEGDRVCGAGQG